MDMIKQIEAAAEKYFVGANGSHDWDHTKRVLNLCLHLGQKENADLEILQLAALLHDIGRSEQDKTNGQVCHAAIGAKIAQEILTHFGYDEIIINQVSHCIAAHRYRNELVPQTIEAKILFNADKLDSIGATGIGRAFLFAGEINAKLHNSPETIMEQTKAYSQEDTAYREFYLKLQHVKDKLFTNEGRRLAEQRHQYMVDFFRRLNQEIAGDL